MLNRNAGFQKLFSLVAHLCSVCGSNSALSKWLETRWTTVCAQLEDCASIKDVNEFIDVYAASLADDLTALVAQGADGETALAAIDFVEELYRQAGNVREEIRSQRESSRAVQTELPGAITPPEYALAA